MTDRIFMVFSRHSNYLHKGFDGVITNLHGVYNDRNKAFDRLIELANRKTAEAKIKFGDKACISYDGEGYYEALLGDNEKYEIFVVDVEEGVDIEENIT